MLQLYLVHNKHLLRRLEYSTKRILFAFHRDNHLHAHYLLTASCILFSEKMPYTNEIMTLKDLHQHFPLFIGWTRSQQLVFFSHQCDSIRLTRTTLPFLGQQQAECHLLIPSGPSKASATCILATGICHLISLMLLALSYSRPLRR